MKKFLIILLALCFVPCVSACSKKSDKLNCYNIDVVFDGDRTIDAEMTLDYYCKEASGVDVLKFNVFDNAFRKGAKYSPVTGQSYGEFCIKSVSENGKTSDFKICGKDSNILEVKLAKKLSEGETTKVSIAFSATLPDGDYRFCKGEDTVNLGNFYPILCVYENGEYFECEYYKLGDPFYCETSDYNVSITVPSTFVVGASGAASSCDVEGEKTRYTYSVKNCRDFAFCLSKNFEVISEKWGDKTVNYYFLTDKEPQKTLELTISCLQYFSDVFGQYPYDSFSACQNDFDEGGMEYTSLVYINKNLDAVNTKYTVVHEAAHQWWYGVVGNNQLIESYLDEGLTEYSTCLFFDENPDFGVDAEFQYAAAKKACMTHYKILNAIRGEKPYMVKHLNTYSGELDYVNTAYNRGMVMFKSFEEAFGKKKTKAMLKKYYNANKFKIADTNSLLQSAGKNKNFLNSFIQGDAIA